MPPFDTVEAEAPAHAASASDAGTFGRILGRLSELLALIGGAIMLFVMSMTVVSILGRQFLNMPVKGDFEITELACGIAIFLFFPYTQHTGQNIIAEFFTAGLPERHRNRLESAHNLIFAAVAAFLAWRVFEGLLDKLASAQQTMLLGLPVWWGYVTAVGGCALLALVCLWGAARLGFGTHS